MAIQYLVGVVVLAAIFILIRLPKTSRKTLPKISPRQVLQLIGVGVIAAGVSFSYYNALALLSSAVALTLLFQFVWMGVLLQAILERKLPNRFSILAVILVLGGTVFAAGLLEPHEAPLSLPGVAFGLLSALFYTAFLHFSGRVATQLPTSSRVLFTTTGSLLITFCLTPVSFISGALFREFFWFGIPLAIVGIVLPVFLIQKGAPNIPDGVTTIMASSELPSGILMAALFLQDTVGALEWLGVIIILGGIVLSQFEVIKPGKREPKT
jgi:drug/metabolite transporter (DMT)-like permease